MSPSHRYDSPVPDLIIRNLSDLTLERLQRRAEQHGRSMEDEARAIVEYAADTFDARELAARIREELSDV